MMGMAMKVMKVMMVMMAMGSGSRCCWVMFIAIDLQTEEEISQKTHKG